LKTDALLTLVTRIEELLADERQSLASLDDRALRSLNDRKVRTIVELTRVSADLGRHEISVDLRTRLINLREQLEQSRSKIGAHLDTTREIARVLAEASEASESDGTYTRRLAPARTR
jgi:hypothetical protein